VTRGVLYGVAFALLVAAVAALLVAAVGFLESTGLMILSAVFSGLAIVAAVGSLLARR
jgi:hypothetical protein